MEYVKASVSTKVVIGICVATIAVALIVSGFLISDIASSKRSTERFERLSDDLDKTLGTLTKVVEQVTDQRAKVNAYFQEKLHHSGDVKSLQELWSWYDERWTRLKEIGSGSVVVMEELTALKLLAIEAVTDNDEGKFLEAEKRHGELREVLREIRGLLSDYLGEV